MKPYIKGKYPKELIRGLSSKGSVNKDGFVTAEAFNFPKTSDREDHFCELSVNWNDDIESLTNLSTRHKKGLAERQFKIGYCIVKMSIVKQLVNIYSDSEKCRFKYERKPEEASEDNDYQENVYHGNLLLLDSVDTCVRKNIEHTLAAYALFHEWNDDVSRL